MSTQRSDLLAAVGPLAKALRRVEDAAAGAAGVTMWQYAILSVALADPGRNQGAVAAELEYSPNRIVGDLDELERRRLLTRAPGADRRANEVRVTAAGARLVTQVRADIHRREDELLAALPADRRAAVLAAATAIADALRERR